MGGGGEDEDVHLRPYVKASLKSRVLRHPVQKPLRIASSRENYCFVEEFNARDPQVSARQRNSELC